MMLVGSQAGKDEPSPLHQLLIEAAAAALVTAIRVRRESYMDLELKNYLTLYIYYPLSPLEPNHFTRIG